MDKAHGKLSLHCDQYNEATKNAKLLEEKLSSEKKRHCKVETRQTEFEAELETLHKEVKTLGKWKETPVSHKWCEWESASNSDTAKQLLSKASRKL